MIRLYSPYDYSIELKDCFSSNRDFIVPMIEAAHEQDGVIVLPVSVHGGFPGGVLETHVTCVVKVQGVERRVRVEIYAVKIT